MAENNTTNVDNRPITIMVKPNNTVIVEPQSTAKLEELVKNLVEREASPFKFDIPTIALAISTAVLAGATYFYLQETKRIRKSSQYPSFSLEPTLYTLDGSFHFLNLVNTGQSAHDMKIDCSWGTRVNPNHSTLKFYVMSLSTDGHARLENLPIADIVKNQEILLIKIHCKDARGEVYDTEFEIDFSTITAENRKLTYQYTSYNIITSSIEKIDDRLRDVERTFRDLGTELRRSR